jgi:pyruvate/2-oxoglutarate dehydrogenase complex dihydrolipoamide acyltransferase (E2) component
VVVVDDVVVVVGGSVVVVVEVVVVVVGGRVVVVEGFVDVVVVESGAVVVVEETVVVVESDPDSSSTRDWEARNRPSKAAGSSKINVGAGRALEATAENDMLASRPAASPRSVGTVTSAGGAGASMDSGAKTANPAKNKAMKVMPVAMRKAKRRMK